MHRAAAAVLVVAALLAGPADAQSLFSGNITTQRAVVSYFPELALTASGSGSGSGSVTGSAPASFMLPAGAFTGTGMTVSTSTGYYRSVLPGVPRAFTFSANLARSNSGPGSFGPVFSPGAVYTVFPNSTTGPQATINRQGYMRIKMGSQGFGGNMPLATSGTYAGHKHFIFKLAYFSQTLMAVRGTGLIPTALSNQSALIGMSTHTMLMSTGGGPLIASVLAVSTHAPWFTGTVTAVDSLGVYGTNFTVTGADNRNAAGTAGTISLVTPQILHLYSVSGTTVSQLLNQSASTSTLVLSFTPLPEPGRLTLLAAGLLGLLVRTRMRSR